MKDRIERGTYADVVFMHDTAIRNGWIAIICHDAAGFFLRLIGKVKP